MKKPTVTKAHAPDRVESVLLIIFFGIPTTLGVLDWLGLIFN